MLRVQSKQKQNSTEQTENKRVENRSVGQRGWGRREVEKYLRRDVARPSWEKR